MINNENKRVAVKMNIVGTKKVIDLCKKIPDLKAFVHVSTAYANCNRTDIIKEKVYKPPVNQEKIISFSEWVPNNLVEKITPDLIQPRPNTYTYTKAIAESLVVEECEDKIPCAIVRPSIVGASYQEPMPGWVDLSGATFMFASLGKGLKRVMLGDLNCNADVIPVDYCVNMILVAGLVLFCVSCFYLSFNFKTHF